MSGFTDGLVAGLASPTALTNSIYKLSMLGPQIEQARQKGILNGASAAYNQAKAEGQIAATARARETADQIEKLLGPIFRNVDTSNPTNILNAYLTQAAIQQGNAIREAYPLEGNRQLVERMTTAAKPSSFSEDAQVTPPISAFGRKQAPMSREQIRQAVGAVLDEANLRKQQDLLGRAVAMTKGQGSYQNIGNTGYALDKHLGTSGVANDALVRMYTTNQDLKNENIRSTIANRNEIRERRKQTPIRGTGGGKKKHGGGRGGQYVDEVRFGQIGKLNRKNGNWSPYSANIQRQWRRGGGSGGSSGGGSSRMSVSDAMAFAKAHPEFFDSED